jgi:hypothetical protein
VHSECMLTHPLPPLKRGVVEIIIKKFGGNDYEK